MATQTLQFHPGLQFLPQAYDALRTVLATEAATIVFPATAQILEFKSCLKKQGFRSLLPKMIPASAIFEPVPPKFSRATQYLLQWQQLLQQHGCSPRENENFMQAKSMLKIWEACRDAYLLFWIDNQQSGSVADYFEKITAQLKTSIPHADLNREKKEWQLLVLFWEKISKKKISDIHEPCFWPEIQGFILRLPGPLVYIHTGPAWVAVQAVLHAASKKLNIPAIHIQASWSMEVEEKVKATQKIISCNTVLQKAWPELWDVADTAPKSVATPQHPFPPLQVVSCLNREELALHAAQTIHAWQQRGLKKLAIVVHDRLLTRRIRALLHRFHIKIQDQQYLQTSLAAQVINAWLDLFVQIQKKQAFGRKLLLCLQQQPIFAAHSPFANFARAFENIMQQMVLLSWTQLQQAVQKNAAISSHGPTCDILTQLPNIAHPWKTEQQKTFKQWCELLHSSLSKLHLQEGLKQDACGNAILEFLQVVDGDCLGEFSLSAFQRYWHAWLAETPCPAKNKSTDIALLPLSAMKMRVFDAVLLVACEEGSFPSQPATELLIEKTFTAKENILSDCAEILLNHAEICCSWQRQGDAGQPQTLNAQLQRLLIAAKRYSSPVVATIYQRLWQHTQYTPTPRPQPCLNAISARCPGENAKNHPLLPQQMSSHSYNALRRCPYQFFGHHILGLNESHNIETPLTKQHIGSWIHEILSIYHQQNHPLHALSQEFFQEKITQHGIIAFIYAQRWQKQIPFYLEWQKNREAEGWRVQACETRLQRALPDLNLTLIGRIDRIDAQRDNNHNQSLLDYKLQTRAALLPKTKGLDEDLQLPFYLVLHNESEQISLLALAGETVSELPLLQPTKLKETLKEQLYQDWQRLSSGHVLRAQGKDKVCQYCEMQGLCRKSHWPDCE